MVSMLSSYDILFGKQFLLDRSKMTFYRNTSCILAMIIIIILIFNFGIYILNWLIIYPFFLILEYYSCHRNVHQARQVQCTECEKVYSNLDNLKTHIQEYYQTLGNYLIWTNLSQQIWRSCFQNSFLVLFSS